MRTITQAGGIILPAAPSFYSRPADMNELVDTITHRVLDLIGLDAGGYRWAEDE
jgi:4-hydroxy-3-polyprenylbenzoate decarboxylase